MGLPLRNTIMNNETLTKQHDYESRVRNAWNTLVNVLKENPETAIREFIEYSKSANISRFGFLNRSLLFSQSKGKARFVHTPKQWENLGRKIKPGEKPLKVFVIFPAKGNPDRLIYREFEEYDVSQTEGEFIAEPEIQENNPETKLWESLEQYATGNLNLRLSNRPLGMVDIDALGSTDGRLIYVRKDLTPVKRARILAHEIAHVILHFRSPGDILYEPDNGKPLPAQSLKEVEADAVACLVCAAWRLDVTEHAKYYLMLFTDGSIRPEDVAKNIFDAVTQILRHCHPP